MLTGDRRGTWSLAVTANRRITLRIDRDEMEVTDLDYENSSPETDARPVHGIRMKGPVHPGEFVKCRSIEALDLSVTAAA